MVGRTESVEAAAGVAGERGRGLGREKLLGRLGRQRALSTLCLALLVAGPALWVWPLCVESVTLPAEGNRTAGQTAFLATYEAPALGCHWDGFVLAGSYYRGPDGVGEEDWATAGDLAAFLLVGVLGAASLAVHLALGWLEPRTRGRAAALYFAQTSRVLLLNLAAFAVACGGCDGWEREALDAAGLGVRLRLSTSLPAAFALFLLASDLSATFDFGFLLGQLNA